MVFRFRDRVSNEPVSLDRISNFDDIKVFAAADYSTSGTIEVCDRCKGLGFNRVEKLTDYHRGEYDTFTEKCERCDGDGRVFVVRKSMKIIEEHNKTVVPYNGQSEYSSGGAVILTNNA